LKTVCAFANTNGGLLIYGIDAKDGIPTEINGILVDNKDKLGMQITNIIRDNSEPSISSSTIEFIDKSESDNVFILIKVPRSWNLPHRVSLTNNKKLKHFYIRGDFHNNLMDIFELRTAFNLSETLADKIRRFREERISSILADETPVPLNKGGKLVVHLIPLNSFYPGQSYDIDKIYGKFRLGTISDDYIQTRYNFDGLLDYGTPLENDGISLDYTQLYRNGIIESATVYYSDYKNKIISHQDHEIGIVRAIKGFLGIYGKLNVAYPVFVFVTLVGVKDYRMGKKEFFGSHEKNYIIDKDVLANPEIVLTKYPENIGNELKPVFDAIRNACGFQGSKSYDDESNWRY